MKEKIKNYRKVQSLEIRQAMMNIAKVRENKSIATSPESILFLLDKALEGEYLCSSEMKLPLTGTNSSDFSVRKAREAIGEVEKKIRYLVEGITSAGMLVYVSSRENNQNFDYNILSSYLSLFAVFSPTKK